MIESMGIAALKGLAKSLGDRLMTSPKEAVSVKTLADEIAALRVEQHQNQMAMTAVMTQFAQIIGQVNGLVLSGSAITYRQTELSPTLGDSLLLLHRRIEELGQAAPQPTPPTVIVVRPETLQELPVAPSPMTSPGPTRAVTGAAPSAGDMQRDVFKVMEDEINRRRSQGGGQK